METAEIIVNGRLYKHISAVGVTRKQKQRAKEKGKDLPIIKLKGGNWIAITPEK